MRIRSTPGTPVMSYAAAPPQFSGGSFALPAAVASVSLGPVDIARMRPARGAQRQQAIRGARGLLAALDRLRLGQLSGNPAEALADLGRLCAAERGAAGDPALDELIAMIDLRAAVELAKARQRRAAEHAPATGNSLARA